MPKVAILLKHFKHHDLLYVAMLRVREAESLKNFGYKQGYNNISIHTNQKLTTFVKEMEAHLFIFLFSFQ